LTDGDGFHELLKDLKKFYNKVYGW
jgi:hypothetical protein